MSQITGFGQQFQQTDASLQQHQHTLHQIIHQGQVSMHQQQRNSQQQQQRMSQPQTQAGFSSQGGFSNQGGGVPYVKIVEQPSGNKLRFRFVFFLFYSSIDIFGCNVMIITMIQY